jgi:AcrR family transcriptional regulator
VDLFYSTLLERVLVEGEPEEVHRVAHKQSTKEKILDAALEVFSEKGFHVTTVDEIAEHAGVGKGTLYRHFANKETLFNELVKLRLAELERNAMAALDGQDDVLTMIAKYLRVYFTFFDRNQQLYRLIVQERLDFGEHVQDLYFKKVMRRIHALKKKTYEASQQGILKDVDFQTVFYGVMGFVHGVIQKWMARDCSYSLVEELPGVLEVLFYGFVKKRTNLTRQGEKDGSDCNTTQDH